MKHFPVYYPRDTLCKGQHVFKTHTQERNLQTQKKKIYGYLREKVGGGINKEAGIRARVWVEINIYTLQYIKLVINKDLLYTTRTFIQHCVKISMGNNFKK